MTVVQPDFIHVTWQWPLWSLSMLKQQKSKEAAFEVSTIISEQKTVKLDGGWV